MVTGNGNFFGDGKMITFGMLPINQPDSLVLCAHGRLHLDPIAQQAVDGPVSIVDVLVAAYDRRLVELT